MEPQMNADARRLNEITERVIGCAYDIANGMGTGFLEKVYENAMFVELTRCGLKARQQYPIVVTWRGAVVGNYDADLLIEDCVLVELKACKALDEIHVAQCLNNFGKVKIEVRRLVNF
jgi:GxxExxY protein